MSRRSRRVAAVVLTAAVAAGSLAAGNQVAVAAPVAGGYHQNPAVVDGIVKVVKVVVSWWALETVSDEVVPRVNEKIVEGIQKVSASGPSPDEAARAFFASVPTVNPSGLTTASLVTVAKYVPSGAPNRVAYVRGKPQALFSAITSGGVRVNKNQFKVGVETVTFKPGTKSTPPSITISDSVTSTKVIVLA